MLNHLMYTNRKCTFNKVKMTFTRLFFAKDIYFIIKKQKCYTKQNSHNFITSFIYSDFVLSPMLAAPVLL